MQNTQLPKEMTTMKFTARTPMLSKPATARFAGCLLAFTTMLLGVSSVAAQAQSTDATGPRETVTLASHTPDEVRDGTAVRMGHYNLEQKLRLTLAVQPPHMAEEEEFLKDIETIGSPNFRKFLTAEEWNDRFGPSVEDEQKVVDWAQSQGLTVTHRFPNRLLVDVEAPVGVIEKAFRVTINSYLLGDEVDFSNDLDPQIPASLSNVLSAVLGLNSIQRFHRVGGDPRDYKGPDYAPGPVYAEVASSQGDGDPSRSPSSRKLASAEEAPAFDRESTPTATPSNIMSSEAYDYDALQNLSHCCNVHNDSNGSPADTSIALVTYGGFNDSDATAFFKNYGFAWNYNAYAINGHNEDKECNVGSSGCPGLANDGEAPLDLEYSTAYANSFGSWKDTAHVYVYEAVNGYYSTYADLFNFIVNDNHAHVVSTSYGWPELSADYAQSVATGTMHPIFNSMTGQGWTLIAASGDNGASDGCTDADAVDFPSSDPNFLAAGGTELSLNKDGSYAGEVAWTGGTSSKSCSSNSGGGGGGHSNWFSQPGWQNGLGGNMRKVPDISLNAGGIAQLYYQSGGWYYVWGTSIVAPQLAGFFAQENSYLNSIGHICGSDGSSHCEPIGNPNPMIYYEAMHKNAAHDPFYDITKGCNSNNITKEYDLTVYCAGPGYDEATGWGSANMLQLAWALNWEIIPASGAPYITWKGPATNKWYNTNQTVNWTIHDWEPKGSTPGPGIAGETQGWDSIPADPSKESTPGSGNSFYSGPQFPDGSTGCLAFEPNGCSGGVSQGCHTAHARGWNNQGWNSANNTSFPETYGPLCYDTIAPATTLSTKINTVTSVTVTLTATDPGASSGTGSGVADTYYSVDKSSCSASAKSNCTVYQKPFTINTKGTHTVLYFSVDNAGNAEEVHTKAITIGGTL
jgi:subtilase family serine protease